MESMETNATERTNMTTTYYAHISRTQHSILKHTYIVEAHSIDEAVFKIRDEASQDLISARHLVWFHELGIKQPNPVRPTPVWMAGNYMWMVHHSKGEAMFSSRAEAEHYARDKEVPK